MDVGWDPIKAKRSVKDHQVSFEEAKTVWDDLFNVEFYDSDHSDEEDRFLIIGESNQGRYLIVSFTEPGKGIRIITARELTPKERRDYEDGNYE